MEHSGEEIIIKQKVNAHRAAREGGDCLRPERAIVKYVEQGVGSSNPLAPTSKIIKKGTVLFFIVPSPLSKK
jgi:hypothetical protein